MTVDELGDDAFERDRLVHEAGDRRAVMRGERDAGQRNGGSDNHDLKHVCGLKRDI
jgi:hypothetical protein